MINIGDLISNQVAKQQAQFILAQIQPWFKRLPNTMYRLIVVNDVYDQHYNFYIEVKRRRMLTRIIPLYEFNDNNFNSLLLILQFLNQNCHLTAEFRNFTEIERKQLIHSFH